MTKRKTITYKDLEKLLISGMCINLKKGHHPEHLRGWYNTDTHEARIYMPEHETPDDITITILHECVHAKYDEIFGTRARVTEKQECKIAEEIAERTLEKRHNIGEFIKGLWGLCY